MISDNIKIFTNDVIINLTIPFLTFLFKAFKRYFS